MVELRAEVIKVVNSGNQGGVLGFDVGHET